MKKIFLLISCCLFTFLGFANTDFKSAGIQFTSFEESSVSGNLSVDLTINFYDSLDLSTLQDSFAVVLPQNWQVTAMPYLPQTNFVRGDNHQTAIDITYPTSNLPFYPQTISLQLYSKATAQSEPIKIAERELKVYFTPYNTVEIWDIVDFYDLKREWLINNNESKPRIYVDPNSIPESDIPSDFEPEEEWEEDFQTVFIEGLAYAIPMMAVHPDSIELIPEAQAGDGGIQLTGGGCGFLGGGRRYLGTISGNIQASIDNDLTGGMPNQPMKGLTVEIWEKIGEIMQVHLAKN
jgi:hypothetical protein